MAMAERNVLVCGAGLMGHGIGQSVATAGHRVVLYEPEMARAPSGVTATASASPLCPARVFRQTPVFTFQTLRVVSSEPDTTRLPSGIIATAVT